MDMPKVEPTPRRLWREDDGTLVALLVDERRFESKDDGATWHRVGGSA